jgi:hypothetical protein
MHIDSPPAAGVAAPCRVLIATAAVLAALAAILLLRPEPSYAKPMHSTGGAARWAAGVNPSATTKAYVTRFYPRFLTGLLERIGHANEIVGPDSMGPPWGIVVAPNDDTIYAQFRLDLSQGPQILTIPATTANYSILGVDAFGDVFHTSIPTNTPGTYALVPPGFQGSLPQRVTPITAPYSSTFWTIRADRFTDGANSESAAETFRSSLQLQSLADYNPASTSGHTRILPLAVFGLQSKTVADVRIRLQPIQFLITLQSRMHEGTTSPLTSSDMALEKAFDADLAAAQQSANSGSPHELSKMAKATQAAHTAIVKDWTSHTVQRKWVYFDNIGNWGTDYLDRAATAEFLLFGNDITTAKYFDAFTDAKGAELTGIGNHAYRLTFPAGAIPRPSASGR